MNRIAFSTLLMGLLVGAQPVRVETSPDMAPSAVVFYLDGKVVGRSTSAPWETKVDFGQALRPHELTAEALDRTGSRIAAVSRVVNLPAPAARVDILIDRNALGVPRGARIVATSLRREKPVRSSLSLDGTMLALDRDGRATLPTLDLAQAHVLSGVAEFAQDAVARTDVALGGGIVDESGSRLTAVPIRVAPGANPAVESLQSSFRHGSDSLHVVAVEKGDATVLLVRDPRSATAERAIGRDRAGTGTRLGDRDRVGLIWPVSHEERIGDQEIRLIEATPYFTGKDGSLLWVLSRVSRKSPSSPPYLYGDAVAVAGLLAYQATTRRAVVLVGWSSFDASLLKPSQVLSYLRDLGVPLHVWSFDAQDSSWGDVAMLSSFGDYLRASAALVRDLETQRIVWVAGEWQPGQVELSPESVGISLLR